jgi:hypothetical protein
MHLELYNKIVINRKQRNIFQIFQNEMCFPFLHYTSKNEMKDHECCQKQNHNKLPIEKYIYIYQKMHATRIKQTRNPKGSNHRSLFEYVIPIVI